MRGGELVAYGGLCVYLAKAFPSPCVTKRGDGKVIILDHGPTGGSLEMSDSLPL